MSNFMKNHILYDADIELEIAKPKDRNLLYFVM